MCIIGNEAQNW